jgi:hypothetical protein
MLVKPKRFVRPLASFLLVLLAACSSEKDEEPKTFQALYDSYLKKCSDCHVAGNEAENSVPNFDFSSADRAYESLTANVNVPRSESCLNLNLPYVVAGQPSQSYLLAILDEGTNDGYEAATSSSCSPLKHTAAFGGVAAVPSAGVVAGLKTWISEGARR